MNVIVIFQTVRIETIRIVTIQNRNVKGIFERIKHCQKVEGMINYSYCSLVVSREVFFVSEGHRKPETYRANLCD